MSQMANKGGEPMSPMINKGGEPARNVLTVYILNSGNDKHMGGSIKGHDMTEMHLQAEPCALEGFLPCVFYGHI